MEIKDKTKALFLCVGNSCRSQMAEGICSQFWGDTIGAYSAGIEAQGLNPYAVKAMSEIGIDISGQRSKTIDELGEKEFDYVVTLCDEANESCPLFPARTSIIHRSFDDPQRLAAGAAEEEEVLSPYRRVRDEIKDFISGFPSILRGERPDRAD